MGSYIKSKAIPKALPKGRVMKAKHWDYEQYRTEQFKHGQEKEYKKKPKDPKSDPHYYPHIPEKEAIWHHKTLTDEEFEKFFWEKLIPLGWRADRDSIVLPCEECEKVLLSCGVLGAKSNNKVEHLYRQTVPALQRHKQECKSHTPKGE